MIKSAEEKLIAADHRILLVAASSLPEFKSIRTFFRKLRHDKEARIRKFYDAGEDKIVFRKASHVTK